LDEIFYFSRLRSVLTGGVRLIDDSDLDIEGQYNPQTRHIDINLGGHDYDDGQIEQHFIDTLLHEMLHADGIHLPEDVLLDKTGEGSRMGTPWDRAWKKLVQDNDGNRG